MRERLKLSTLFVFHHALTLFILSLEREKMRPISYGVALLHTRTRAHTHTNCTAHTHELHARTHEGNTHTNLYCTHTHKLCTAHTHTRVQSCVPVTREQHLVQTCTQQKKAFLCRLDQTKMHLGFALPLGASRCHAQGRSEPHRGRGPGHDQRGRRRRIWVPRVPRVLPHDAQEDQRL